MQKLPKEIAKLVDDLCREGDRFAELDQYDDAIEKYSQAWDVLPEPKEQWPAATWIAMSVGDAHFRNGEYPEAVETLEHGLSFPDAEQNAFIWLRLGQSLFELHELNDAADALEEAFRMAGETLFEDEPPKYLAFVKTQLSVMPIKGREARR